MFAGGRIQAVAAHGDTVVAVGTAGDPAYGPAAAWVRTAGRWTRATLDEPGGVLRAVAATDTGFVAVGQDAKDERAGLTLHGRRSWSVVADQPSFHLGTSPVRMLSIAADAHGFVVGGWRSDAANGSSAAWTSTDGSTWQASRGRGPSPGGRSPASWSTAAARSAWGGRGTRTTTRRPHGRGFGRECLAVSRMASRPSASLRVEAIVSLNDLLWVANTAHGPGGHWHARVRGDEPDHDHLADLGGARTYLADHAVSVPPDPPDPASLGSLRTIRTVIQRLADGGGAADAWTPDARRLLDSTAFRLAPAGRLRAADDGWSGTTGNLLVALVALVAEDPGLGRCANPHCRLVFVDGSRNGRRRWCEPGGCGNRARVARARRPRNAPADPAGERVAGPTPRGTPSGPPRPRAGRTPGPT